MDNNGDTPLHTLLRSYIKDQDRLSCTKSLLKANAPLYIRNNNGLTPLDVVEGYSCRVFLYEYLRDNREEILRNNYDILEHAERKYSGSHCITRVFVLGNSGSGKSSLIESMKREGFFESLWKVSESAVPPHTAGIIPSIHVSKQYGRVLFYDFAGDAEYYSSHAAIFEGIASSRKGDNIFALVVDLREDSVAIETNLCYWFSFIQCQKFKNISLIVLGSHFDLASKDDNKGKVLDQFCLTVQSSVQDVKCFMLDCRNPRSYQIAHLKKEILAWVNNFSKHNISNEASILLGLLEKDFSAVTACHVQTLVTHIKETGVGLPVTVNALIQLLSELHDVGVVMLLGDSTKDGGHVVLNISKLTNEVHKLLFSKSAANEIQKACKGINAAPLNIGILPEKVLAKILPPHITKECLIHLQYCYEIRQADVGAFPSLDQADSTNQSFLFFPALCSVDKSQVSWDEPTGNSFSIGWLALCTDPHDYFPPRFLHVLLLRVVYAFTVPAQQQNAYASSEHNRRCTMWKTGVQWSNKKGVDLMVELVSGSKGVVIHCKSSIDRLENCIDALAKVVSCVMEAKAEFCHSIKPQFFLLDSSVETDYLNEDHQFAMSDVERALAEGDEVALSIGRGRGKIELSKLRYMRKLTHWDNLFPIHFNTVLHVLRDIVDNVFDLGSNLGAPWAFLRSLEVDFPFDVSRRRRELVRWWMSSSPDPPCWWNLVQALKMIGENALAEEIRKEHGECFSSILINIAGFIVHLLIAGLHIELQEKMLSKANHEMKLEKEFLHSLSGVVGSRWPSLAVSLSLSEGEIEGLKEKVGLSQQQLALQALRMWSPRGEATYGQLYNKLMTISLFRYST